MTDDGVPVPTDEALAAVEELVGHTFADRGLLARALTHPSAGEGASSGHDYERLEFLGDAVLGLIVVEEIFSRFPAMQEGEMTKLKISLVSGGVLADAAAQLGLFQYIVTGRSEQGTGERGLRSTLENVYEALTGALYIDAGLQAARSFVIATLGDRIDPATIERAALEHPKSELQELLQARGLVPVYRIVAEEGPPHDCRFTSEVTVAGRVEGSGTGNSKKQAEMAAAARALERYLAP